MLLTYEHCLEQQNAIDEANLLQTSVASLQSQRTNYEKNQRFGKFKFQRGNHNQGQQHSISSSLVITDVVSIIITTEIQVEAITIYLDNFSITNFYGDGDGKTQCQACSKYGHNTINCYHPSNLLSTINLRWWLLLLPLLVMSTSSWT